MCLMLARAYRSRAATKYFVVTKYSIIDLWPIYSQGTAREVLYLVRSNFIYLRQIGSKENKGGQISNGSDTESPYRDTLPKRVRRYRTKYSKVFKVWCGKHQAGNISLTLSLPT